jgi:hypothetical protein
MSTDAPVCPAHSPDRRTRHSAAIHAWAASMPALVNAPPESTRLDLAGGKGLS